MWRGRWVRAVVAFGLTGALVGVVPSGAAVPAHARCRPTAFVADGLNGSVSTIDVKTRAKNPNDIAVGPNRSGVAVTPDGRTAVVVNNNRGSVSTIDVKTRTKNPNDIGVSALTLGVAITPCRQ
jgi:DNA-binding beta-propeller fold protein YncE